MANCECHNQRVSTKCCLAMWSIANLPICQFWHPKNFGIIHSPLVVQKLDLPYGSVSKPCTPVVHIKIAGKWMFIPVKMVLIGIDPYPYLSHLSIHDMLTHAPCHPPCHPTAQLRRCGTSSELWWWPRYPTFLKLRSFPVSNWWLLPNQKGDVKKHLGEKHVSLFIMLVYALAEISWLYLGLVDMLAAIPTKTQAAKTGLLSGYSTTFGHSLVEVCGNCDRRPRIFPDFFSIRSRWVLTHAVGTLVSVNCFIQRRAVK